MFGDKTTKRVDCTKRIHMGTITVTVRPKDVVRYGRFATVKATKLTGTVTTVPHWDQVLDYLHTQYGVAINVEGEEKEFPFSESELDFWD